MKKYWVIAKKQSIAIRSIADTKSFAIDKFEAYYGTAWIDARKEGWRAISVNITPTKKKEKKNETINQST